MQFVAVEPTEHSQELIGLRSCLFIAGGSYIITNIFAHRAGWHVDYGLMWLHNPLMMQGATPKIVETQLRLIFSS